MYRFLLVVIMMAFAIMPASADGTKGSFDFNKDRFLVGSTVVQDKVGVDDLFIAGETIESKQDITGSAHLAGRKVTSTGTIGGDAYLAGMEVTLDGTVTGDVTVAGYTIQIGEVVGDLRVTGANLTLSGPVSGYALVAGENVTFNSVVKGDVNLMADEVDFTDASRIEGKLIIYEEETGEISVPAQVISEDQVERRDISEWSETGREDEAEGFGSKLFGLFKSVLFITVLAAVIAAVRPQKLADLRQSILAQPFRNLLFGFLGISAILGATILLLVTGIGFRLALVSLLMAALAAFMGYAIGAYTIGVKALQLANRPDPDSLGAKTFAAGVGAFIVSVIALVPYLGWIVILAVTVVGAGSIVIRLFRPKLMAIE